LNQLQGYFNPEDQNKVVNLNELETELKMLELFQKAIPEYSRGWNIPVSALIKDQYVEYVNEEQLLEARITEVFNTRESIKNGEMEDHDNEDNDNHENDNNDQYQYQYKYEKRNNRVTAQEKRVEPDTVNLTFESYQTYIKLMCHRAIQDQLSVEEMNQFNEDYKLYEVFKLRPTYKNLHLLLAEMGGGYLNRDKEKMSVPYFNDNGNFNQLSGVQTGIHKMHGTKIKAIIPEYFDIFAFKVKEANFHRVKVLLKK